MRQDERQAATRGRQAQLGHCLLLGGDYGHGTSISP